MSTLMGDDRPSGVSLSVLNDLMYMAYLDGRKGTYYNPNEYLANKDIKVD